MCRVIGANILIVEELDGAGADYLSAFENSEAYRESTVKEWHELRMQVS